MNLLLLYDRIWQKIKRTYRNAVFFSKTGCRVNLLGNMTLINTNLKIGKNVTFYPDVMLFGDGLIEIGDNVDLGNGTVIYASKNGGGVKIGDNSLIAAQSYIIDTDHGIRAGELIRKQAYTVSPVSIGKDVWIAAGCKILKGSQIGNGAIIGAQSVVKGTIPECAIAVGIPAKVIKYRE